MAFHYHGTIKISERAYKILLRAIPVLESPDFLMRIEIEPHGDDIELGDEVKKYILSSLLALKRMERIQ